ncbi:uncharacterized protein LOC128238228 [Mya arenaria]|uniref:uncharacterized protein LOC128238228 n=1 Tax=Mya arenaria TaxID=6604 RepID=UPI0022E76F9C|nr:uncharacterized protein LOC128238228 [Mya arenaria]
MKTTVQNIHILVLFGCILPVQLLNIAEGQKECYPKGDATCSCDFSDGSGTLDFTSLGGKNSQPRFKDIQQEGATDLFSYSPCGGFEEGRCQNAAVCMTTEGQQQQIGDNGKAMYGYDDSSDSVVIAYTSKSSVLSISEVTMKCDPNVCVPQFVPQGQRSVGDYRFTLTTVCACPNMCTASGPTNCNSSSGSAGSIGPGLIVIIAFASIALVYVIMGVTYGRLKNNARGTDLIPNKTFWTSLPGLAKDGVLFIVNKIRGRPLYDAV